MGTITYFNDWKRKRQNIKDEDLERKRFEAEQCCNALFIFQHSDDDSFENKNEFEFTGKKD